MSTKEKVLLSGNEAIARGAWEAGVTLAAAYPGTPSTEILQNLIQYEEIYAQWSPNEKVAVEFAFGGAVGGARSIASMKHVGLNVAADPFFSASYAGVNGGFVVVSADDPSMHSSQNEQDNRRLGIAAKVPVLEPIDSQTAKDLTKEAFEISERFDTPVLIRTTTRINHGTSVVELGERSEVPVKKYRKDAQKFMMLPSVSRKRRHVVEKRLKDLEEYANTTPFNIVEMNDTRIGIVTAGIAVQHAKEVFPDASYLTLQISYPFPRKLVREFAAKVDKLLVIEELDDIMETEIKAMGIECTGKDLIPNIGELRPEILEEVAGQFCIDEDFKPMDVPEFDTLPSRPPVLCAGCGHRSVFYVLHKLRAAVMGDIGCYTLGAYKPLDAMDTSLAMGASIGMAHGIERAQRDNPKKLRSVAVIGDS
ncbi:indolepyruvate ferredoxin oxidoreductase subunit alpha, partial [Myxococcota bacterium]|nr:indolepyruvate ferredoxin oxidoreductase subunit alpha [Myxococcota bacterium]